MCLPRFTPETVPMISTCPVADCLRQGSGAACAQAGDSGTPYATQRANSPARVRLPHRCPSDLVGQRSVLEVSIMRRKDAAGAAGRK